MTTTYNLKANELHETTLQALIERTRSVNPEKINGHKYVFIIETSEDEKEFRVFHHNFLALKPAARLTLTERIEKETRRKRLIASF